MDNKNGYINSSKRDQDRGSDSGSNVKRKKDWLGSIPPIVKSIFIKFWIAGATYFFLWMSEIALLINRLDLLVALGLVLGLFLNIIYSNVMRACEEGDGKHLQYILFHKKKWYFLFADLLYGVVLIILTMLVYTAINTIINNVNGYSSDIIKFKTDPLGVGAIVVIIDFVFILGKKLVFKIFKLNYGFDSEMVSDDDEIILEE